jgi:redox-sensitive bicupin YhaK (pirin superfamily)
MSPFVLVDHFVMTAPTFDVHPHAGMSAVTLLFEDTRSEMSSVDSIGHRSTFGAGDLHWTLAGRGILHTQLPVSPDARIHALQIFVNLPDRAKATPPDSFKVAGSDMPQIESQGVRLRLVAGELSGRKSPAKTPEPVLMIDGYLESPQAPVIIPIPAEWNAWLYVISGSLTVDGAISIAKGQAVCASEDANGTTLRLTANGSNHFVLLAGPRIDEPIVQHGPFVFTSMEDVARAIAAVNSGQFGEVRDLGEPAPPVSTARIHG